MGTKKGKDMKENNRLEFIDSIRGISCILVYVCHWFGTLGGGNPNFLGKIGVGFLFALSGYCLMEIYHKDSWTLRKLVCFYIKRFFAIYPCLIIAFVMALLLNFCKWSDIVSTIKLQHGYSHFWSISVNIIFYLLFPALSYAIQRIGVKSSVVLFWIGLPVWGFYYTKLMQISNVLLFVPMCLAGILVYLHKEISHNDNIDYRDVFSILPCVLFAVVGFIMYSLTTISEITIEATKIIAGTIVCSFCLYFIITRTHVKNVLGNERLKWLHYIGRISYEIYLTHLIILVWILNITAAAEKHALVSETIASICLTVMCSSLMYAFIQRPINKVIVNFSKSKALGY